MNGRRLFCLLSADRHERALVEMVLEGQGEDYTIRTARIGPFDPFVFP